MDHDQRESALELFGRIFESKEKFLPLIESRFEGVLEMIERKNRELKKREEELLLKEKNLQALEKKVLSDRKK